MTCLQAAQRLADRAGRVLPYAHLAARTDQEVLAFLEFSEALMDMRRVLAKSHYEAKELELIKVNVS